jgi:hypothetical protein
MKKFWLTHIIFALGTTVGVCNLMAQVQLVYNPDPGILASPADATTAVRFFFHPPGSDRFVYPLVVRVAPDNDEKMKTAPLLTEGRTVYISLPEMKDLLGSMERSIMMGQQTRNVEVFGSWEMIPSSEAMDVFVISSKGAARGVVLQKDICKTLSSLDSSIRNPRALWEFEKFRLYNGCRVPGFDDAKYSDQ